MAGRHMRGSKTFKSTIRREELTGKAVQSRISRQVPVDNPKDSWEMPVHKEYSAISVLPQYDAALGPSPAFHPASAISPSSAPRSPPSVHGSSGPDISFSVPDLCIC